MPSSTLRVVCDPTPLGAAIVARPGEEDAERPRGHSHAERGNESIEKFFDFSVSATSATSAMKPPPLASPSPMRYDGRSGRSSTPGRSFRHASRPVCDRRGADPHLGGERPGEFGDDPGAEGYRRRGRRSTRRTSSGARRSRPTSSSWATRSPRAGTAAVARRGSGITSRARSRTSGSAATGPSTSCIGSTTARSTRSGPRSSS